MKETIAYLIKRFSILRSRHPICLNNTMAGLEWKNLTYTIKAKGGSGKMEERIILDNITGSAKKGQLLAIMGPSGTYRL